MEQARHCSRFWINTGQVRAFAEIATVASERKIFQRIAPTVLPGSNVLDVK